MSRTTSPAMPGPGSDTDPAQAIVRVVPRGGTKSARQIAAQWRYLSRQGRLRLQRSNRHLGLFVAAEEMKTLARSWAEQTGYVAPGERDADSPLDLTTHIVVSFPPGTEIERAFATGRDWAAETFGSGHRGGHYDYVTACHSDRPHPHVHVVVNRRALEGHWLKISKRDPHHNYERLRADAVEIARQHGIMLDASSREARGIAEPAVNFAEYRRRARASAAEPASKKS